MQREPALVAALPRQPGTKEIRFVHLLSGGIDGLLEGVQPPGMAAVDAASGNERLLQLETEVVRLRQDLMELKEQVAKIAGMGGGASDWGHRATGR